VGFSLIVRGSKIGGNMEIAGSKTGSNRAEPIKKVRRTVFSPRLSLIGLSSLQSH
jgi:hypothetical protein